MTLDEILKTVCNSSPDAWETIDVQTIHAWSFSQSFPEGPTKPVSELQPKTHGTRAIYKGDIDISLAWGAEHRDEYAAPWMPGGSPYPDKSVSSIFVELRYRGEVVQYWIMIFLDGFRILIPTPDMVPGSWDDEKRTARWYVSRSDLQLGRLLAALIVSGDTKAGDSTEEALKRTGVEIR